jgi:ABC-type Na+ efflux pump permease subunit
METLAATQVPFNEAAIFAFSFGLNLGLLLAIFNACADFAQEKLQLRDSDFLKYFAVLAAVAVVLVLADLAAVMLWEPSMAVRQEIFNRSTEALGLGFFFFLMLLGMTPVSLLGRFIPTLLRK